MSKSCQFSLLFHFLATLPLLADRLPPPDCQDHQHGAVLSLSVRHEKTDIFRWGEGLPHEGIRAKKFGTSLEAREIQVFGREYPGILTGISRRCLINSVTRSAQRGPQCIFNMHYSIGTSERELSQSNCATKAMSRRAHVNYRALLFLQDKYRITGISLKVFNSCKSLKKLPGTPPFPELIQQ